MEGIEAEALFLKGDENKIRQVLINLLGNAVKFTQEGTVLLKISPVGKDAYRFDVKDTGCGMPESARQLIFEPFRQYESGIKKGGTGLGLHIAQKQLALMDAELHLETMEGKGTHFYFTVHLPASECTASNNDALEGEIVSLAGNAHVKALVVDDVKENRDVLRLLLSAIGVDVCSHENGKAALMSAGKNQPDIIFTDMRMPVMDGYQLLAELKKDEKLKSCKVVSITASAFDKNHEEFVEMGFDDYIAKPFRAPEIYKCLKNLLGVDFIFEDSSSENNQAEKANGIPDMTGIKIPLEIHSKIMEAAELYQITLMEKTLDDLKGRGRLMQTWSTICLL